MTPILQKADRIARELLIRCPDGMMKTVALSGARVSVGRSPSAELSFPDDSGLSRLHFALESEGGEWTVQDLGSKNGTFVNDLPLKARLILKPGDRITAGRLEILFAPETSSPPEDPVVFEPAEESTTVSTLSTDLEGALSNQTIVFERGGPEAATPVQALIRAGQELAENRPLSELFQVILDLAIEAVNAQRGVVLILEGGDLVPKARKGDGFRISTAMRDRVLKEKSSVLVRNADLDDAFKGRTSVVAHRVHTMMAAPLQAKNRIIGLIYLDSPHVLREFTKDDLSLLTVMANVAAIRLENARLAEIEAAERMLKRDLAQAAEIQCRVLPQAAPEIAGLDLAGYNAACRTVGGDYYDFFPYGESRVGLALGDVSGKGMPASLLMMALHAHVQVLAAEPKDLGFLMQRLNKTTCANGIDNRFITFFFGVLDGSTGELAYASAGHNAPIVVRASGAAETLEGGGTVLGILPSAPYSEYHAQLGEGDILALYSDGVTEAFNPKREEYGEARFIEVLQAHRDKPAAAIIEAVTASLAEWAAGSAPTDDITLVVAKRI